VVEPEEAGAADRGPELTLSPPERRLLEALRSSEVLLEEEELIRSLGLPPDVVRGSLQRLRSKHLAVVDEQHHERPVLTARGHAVSAGGLPERRLLDALRAHGSPLAPGEIEAVSGLSAEERSVAIGVLRRHGYLVEGMPLTLRAEAPAAGARLPEETGLSAAEQGEPLEPAVRTMLTRRGLLSTERSSTRRWSVSAEGRALPLPAEDRPQIGALTAERLRDGSWRGATFRPYDVRAEVPFVVGPTEHPYARFLDEFADLLIGLGFQEAEGPLVETEFWNADVLFMPQEHPARSVHDVFFLADVEGSAPPEPLGDRVARVHEGRPLPGEATPLSPGWRVPYRPEIARRSVLRSQTTAVSARFLARRPAPPFRMFSIDRNFRPDALDATHHVEFNQCEGILGEPGTTLRDLVGVFHELAEGIGIHELKLRPSYFPFTEPSVEGYVRHPRLGWIEVFPGGLLRPEVLGPLGIDVPIAAWGIGVTRLAMVALGLSDIRELFVDDLGRLTARGE
jgi:phenylalanyl-tRNA synthetase alpha chain